MHTGFWLGNLREKGHFGDIGIGGRLVGKMDFKEKRLRGRGLLSSGSGQGQLVGCCVHGAEPAGSAKRGCHN